MAFKSRHLLSFGRPFFQCAFLGGQVSLKVNMRRFYREASPDYAQWIRRNPFEMLGSERVLGPRPSPTAHNPVLRMIAGKWATSEVLLGPYQIAAGRNLSPALLDVGTSGFLDGRAPVFGVACFRAFQ